MKMGAIKSSVYGSAISVTLSLLLASHPAAASHHESRAAPGATILDGVTIVDTRDGSLKPDSAILIQDGKIVKIGPAGSMTAKGATHLIAAKGKYVVPGYLDMHAHPLEPSDPGFSLTTMVAYGVTGYRQMGGSDALLKTRKDGKLPTGDVPELLAMPGIVMAGPLASPPEAAVATVRAQKAAGADFIKIVDVKRESFLPVMEEATKALSV